MENALSILILNSSRSPAKGRGKKRSADALEPVPDTPGEQIVQLSAFDSVSTPGTPGKAVVPQENSSPAKPPVLAGKDSEPAFKKAKNADCSPPAVSDSPVSSESPQKEPSSPLVTSLHTNEAPVPVPSPVKAAEAVESLPVSAVTALAEEEDNGGEQLTEYEKMRLAKIKENQAMLAALGVQQAQSDLMSAVAPGSTEKVKKPRAPRKKRDPKPRPPPRASARIASLPELPSYRELEDGSGLAPGMSTVRRKKKEKPSELDRALAGEDDSAATNRYLLSYEEAFPGKVPIVVSDGSFKGWVAPDIVEKYGLANGADEAWEKGGGGQFSFRNVTGSIDSKKKAKIAALKRSGWSSAKAASAMMLEKNPNQYFYRHTAPGNAHHMGEWTPAEHDKFLELAKAHGVGNKWGLFASYFPHRVGYQCSSYYRDVMVGGGLIKDPKFMFTQSGTPEFVGNRGGR